MPKRDSEKDWQRRHPEKVKEYQERYLKDKKRALVTLESWVVEAIDKVKPSDQEYGAWIREFLENWAETSS